MAILEKRNTAKPEEAASWVVELRRLNEKKKTIMAEAMNKCKQITENEIKDLLDDAKAKGWTKAAIKTSAKILDKFDELEELMREQEQDVADDIDALIKSLGGLGELPLGKAAIEAVDPKTKEDMKQRETTVAIIEAVQKDVEAKKKPQKDGKPDEFFDSKKQTTVQ